MIKVKMETSDGKIVERNAYEILMGINDNAMLPELNAMNWKDDSAKIDYLQGRNTPLVVNAPVEPLSDENAKQALLEYKNAMGIK